MPIRHEPITHTGEEPTMWQAQVILAKINEAIKGKEFLKAKPKAANKILHGIAFADCKEFIEPAEHEGWGPIVIYRFSDNSSLTYDGRGYLANRPL